MASFWHHERTKTNAFRMHEGSVGNECNTDHAAVPVIFGFWQDPQLPLNGLAQLASRREVQVSESAICQRFSPQCAQLFLRVLHRLAQVQLESEAVEIPLLKQFSAVIVEDSSTVTLPAELAEIWRGCGGSEGTSEAAVKLFVRW